MRAPPRPRAGPAMAPPRRRAAASMRHRSADFSPRGPSLTLPYREGARWPAFVGRSRAPVCSGHHGCAAGRLPAECFDQPPPRHPPHVGQPPAAVRQNGPGALFQRIPSNPPFSAACRPYPYGQVFRPVLFSHPPDYGATSTQDFPFVVAPTPAPMTSQSTPCRTSPNTSSSDDANATGTRSPRCSSAGVRSSRNRDPL